MVSRKASQLELRIETTARKIKHTTIRLDFEYQCSLKSSNNFLFFFCSNEDILSDVYKIGRTKKNDNAVISLHTNKKNLNNVGTTSKIS